MPVQIEQDSAGARLEIVVRQRVGSLIVFVAMVVVVGVAASARGREMGDPAWIWWPLGLGLAALLWSAYAMSAEERYVFDRRGGSFALARRTALGMRIVAAGPLATLRDVRAAWVGFDDDVRGLELSRRETAPLELPLRSTDLSEDEQSRIVAAITTMLRTELRPITPRR